ncbi:MAG: hypothetical protein OXI96_00355 [Acidimicrobiaceae bacterium]|nr:hypothetical protein [Acidimicrobiaceae bacterium]
MSELFDAGASNTAEETDDITAKTGDNTTVADAAFDVWSVVPGQIAAVRRLSTAVSDPVHAYLLVGPRGSGKRKAATVFAGELLVAADTEAEHKPDSNSRSRRHRRLALQEQHPDVFVFEPDGNQLRREGEATTLIAEMNRTPIEVDRKVIIVDRFHTATAAAAACLLKPIEEPTESTVWVLLSEMLPPEHMTIASRCCRVDFVALTDSLVSELLVAEGLADSESASLIASASGGNLERARMLATDELLESRYETWLSIPDRLDGTGATVAQIVEQLMSLISAAAKSIDVQHKNELAKISEHEKLSGVYTRSEVESRHKREKRQHRTDELRFGLATLARYYQQRISENQDYQTVFAVSEATTRLRDMSNVLERNANEELALQALLLDLQDSIV